MQNKNESRIARNNFLSGSKWTFFQLAKVAGTLVVSSEQQRGTVRFNSINVSGFNNGREKSLALQSVDCLVRKRLHRQASRFAFLQFHI